MNPNRTRDALKSIDLNSEHSFPFFTLKLTVERFRSISKLYLDFVHPMTVLTGTNKIGKTSILAILACSHIEFQMRNLSNGALERCTWSRLIKFTKHDKQEQDWRYAIKYKVGQNNEMKEGWKLKSTKKWSGLAKKTGQIVDRKVVYIDVDRITPAHACSNVLFANTQASNSTTPLHDRVSEYFDYIFEAAFNLAQIAKYQNRASYKLDNTFTSFNSASGEDVLLAVLLDAVQADKKSLILVDELELGLHPKIQRRFVEVLMDIALKDEKQFIVTTHSPTLLSSFDRESRVFLEKKGDGDYRAIPRISVNAAFSKMDSEIFPLVNLFCEDENSLRIISKALGYIQKNGYSDIHKVVNVVPSGSNSQVKENYDVFKRTWGLSRINIGYAAVFDGDQRVLYSPKIGTDDKISFLFSNEAPERFLLRNYLSTHPNKNLQYHVDNSQPHILFEKCVEESVATDQNEVFEQLYKEIELSDDYKTWLIEFQKFILDTCTYFSEKL